MLAAGLTLPSESVSCDAREPGDAAVTLAETGMLENATSESPTTNSRLPVEVFFGMTWNGGVPMTGGVAWSEQTENRAVAIRGTNRTEGTRGVFMVGRVNFN